jgi:hypothetical protein
VHFLGDLPGTAAHMVIVLDVVESVSDGPEAGHLVFSSLSYNPSSSFESPKLPDFTRRHPSQQFFEYNSQYLAKRRGDANLLWSVLLDTDQRVSREHPTEA